MSVLSNPTKTSPERAFVLQKYLLLHYQHDALLRHLESMSQNSSASTSVGHVSTSTSPLSTSPPSPTTALSTLTPNNRHHRRQQRSASMSISFPTRPISPIPELPPTSSSRAHRDQSNPRPTLYKRRSSLPTTLSIVSALTEIEEEEKKLRQVNQQIKTTLTELLNCESVRSDKRYRMWIQKRLMDAERELKGGRSRSRSRRTSLDPEQGLLFP